MKTRIAFLLLALPVCVMAEPVMKPGLWSLTMTVIAEGTRKAMPAVQQCISQLDIADETRTLPRPAGACKLSDVKRTGDSASYELACLNGSVQAQGRAEVRFAAERYDGSVILSMSEHGSAAKLTALSIDARRLGDCPK